MTTPIIPDETNTLEDMRRARHRDLPNLTIQEAWAEHVIIRQHLAWLVMSKRRHLRIVRRDGCALVDEKQWCGERVAHLERLLARHGRAS